MSIWKNIFRLVGRKSNFVTSRAPRVRIMPFHKIHLNLSFAGQKKEYPITNMSMAGLAFRKNNDDSYFALGKKIEGELIIHGRVFSILIEIRHISRDIAGARILNSDYQLTRSIEEYLLYEITGLGLKPVREDLITKENDIETSWYVDGHNNELFIQERKKKIVKFYMTFLGNHVSWNEGDKIRYGYVVEDPLIPFEKQKGASVVKYYEEMPPSLGRMIYRFLLGVQNLESYKRLQIEEILREILGTVKESSTVE